MQGIKLIAAVDTVLLTLVATSVALAAQDEGRASPPLPLRKEGAPVALPDSRPLSRTTTDWQVLVPRLIHSTKVLIIEAMLWIERPLSATELAKMTNGAIAISSFSYHLDRLRDAEALEVVTKLKARKSQGAKKEKFFYFPGEHNWASRVARGGDAVDPLISTALSIAAAVVTVSSTVGMM